MSIPLVDSFESIDSVRLHYVRGGSGKKVLFLHGWGGSVESWGAAIEDMLQRGSDILAVDFPGFGQSGMPPRPWGVVDYSECVRALLVRVDFWPTHIVAHSFGGRISIVLSSTWPDLVNKQVLVAGAGIRTSNPRSVPRFLLEIGKRTLRSPLLSRHETRLRARLYSFLGAEDYLQAGELRETFVKVVEQDLRDYASRIRAPTLLIWGDQDRSTPLAQGRILQSLISDSGLVVFPNAGHFCYLEQPVRFSIIVSEFLKD